MKGKLIVFEGVEGCGKTSQIQLTQEWLLSFQTSVVVTRQPGGTELGLYLRKLLLEAGSHSIIDKTELLLYAADRSQHVEQVIKPALQDGAIVLCDRYTHSTIAYQGWGRGLDINLIDQLNTIATSGLESDLTLWFDVDVEVGLARKRGGGDILDRIEKETIAFHRRVQQGYAHLADSHPEQIVRVDGSLSQEAVQQKIQAILTARLEAWIDEKKDNLDLAP
ncbi:dTMP kinase [Brasilonema octagenarum UFV-E1]|uniref:Thymidylate kinase n=1 Tax=Brasilonema sennae CENA114 TaxID=415709 RepID=A0A856MGV5_9CYAN|nr:dTMP kinase [Brasilonema sennae]QDL09484.1 dTMP kinase [Brasilonema sennae CENA114]QDL15840.1 dTMP kinase [Brasilonema octagenarum UFV-E1]